VRSIQIKNTTDVIGDRRTKTLKHFLNSLIMIKTLLCSINGHNYETINHNSVPPSLINFKADGYIPDSLEMKLVGYTKTVQICKTCGHVKTTTTLGI
jgi:hypothetical protein